MELEEAESAAIAKRLEKLYLELHPSDNLRTIPGVGDHTAPVFLATGGDPARFRSRSSFANYCGIVPGANQSADSEAKGLRMTKAGPAIMRWDLFQAGQISRSHDPPTHLRLLPGVGTQRQKSHASRGSRYEPLVCQGVGFEKTNHMNLETWTEQIRQPRRGTKNNPVEVSGA